MKHLKNLEEFNEFINKNETVIVDFFTSWCGPCKAISPFFESLEKEFTQIKLAKCNCEIAEDVAMKVEIRSIPVFVKYVNGKEVERVTGADKNKLVSLFNEL